MSQAKEIKREQDNSHPVLIRVAFYMPEQREVMELNKHSSVIKKAGAAKLPKRHKCFGCVWTHVLEQRVLCVRMPCVRVKQMK
ncbi:hypothetical protein M3558_05990 [Brevibacillus invocatus]|nr:hypothetical protein [Brevibacillus invocatus]